MKNFTAFMFFVTGTLIACCGTDPNSNVGGTMFLCTAVILAWMPKEEKKP